VFLVTIQELIAAGYDATDLSQSRVYLEEAPKRVGAAVSPSELLSNAIHWRNEISFAMTYQKDGLVPIFLV